MSHCEGYREASLERVWWVQPIISAADFLFANALARLHPEVGPTVEHRGSSGMFKARVGSARTVGEWELVAFASIADGA